MKEEDPWVVDYTKEDFTRNGQTYDLVLDNVGNRSVGDLRRTLNPTGTCVIVGFTSMGRMLVQSILAPMFSRAAGSRILSASDEKPNREDIHFLEGSLSPARLCRQLTESTHWNGSLKQSAMSRQDTPSPK
jgi:NADPH:quinone reductase-like Zn-dependent oxidoreductase